MTEPVSTIATLTVSDANPTTTRTVHLVYLAGPYRAAGAWGIEQNVRRAEITAAQVYALGVRINRALIPIAPHMLNRHFHGLVPDDIVLDGMLALMRQCGVVLMLPRWDESEGACQEHDIAIQSKQSVVYHIDELHDYATDRP